MVDAGFTIPKKQRKQAETTTAPEPQPMDEDPLLASLLDDPPRPSSASASAATTPTPSLSQTPQSQQEGKGKKEKKRKKKKKKDKSSKGPPKSRLVVPGAGHDDSFLYTLRAAGVEGHEYDEYILLDTVDAIVSEDVRGIVGGFGR